MAGLLASSWMLLARRHRRCFHPPAPHTHVMIPATGPGMVEAAASWEAGPGTGTLLQGQGWTAGGALSDAELACGNTSHTRRGWTVAGWLAAHFLDRYAAGFEDGGVRTARDLLRLEVIDLAFNGVHRQDVPIFRVLLGSLRAACVISAAPASAPALVAPLPAKGTVATVANEPHAHAHGSPDSVPAGVGTLGIAADHRDMAKTVTAAGVKSSRDGLWRADTLYTCDVGRGNRFRRASVEDFLGMSAAAEQQKLPALLVLKDLLDEVIKPRTSSKHGLTCGIYYSNWLFVYLTNIPISIFDAGGRPILSGGRLRFGLCP